jgi:hypothetical protein
MELERRWYCRWCPTIYSLVYCQSRNSLKSIRELSRPLILRADETNAEIQAQISRSVCMSVVMALPSHLKKPAVDKLKITRVTAADRKQHLI